MPYTGVRFYLREKNKWTNFLKLNAGFDASFQLDKTTDSANISFIVQDEPVSFKINMWAALFIQSNSNEVEFNEDGTPSNHEQFIIGGYQYYQTLAGYHVTIKLIEPIERLRGVLGETLSYSNQIGKKVDDETLTHDPYNYYTALKRWLQVTPANTDNISRDSEEKDANGIAWWNRLTILDKDFLTSLPFADDTLNELTLYDLLLDVYDSGTGRTPVVYFDINPETKLARNTARDEYLLKFIRQDGSDKPILEWSDLTANLPYGEICSSVMKREDAANYATGLVANVTNLSPSTKVTFPAQGVYALPEVIAEVRDTKSYTSTGNGQWGLVLPHKIKKITLMQQLSVNGYEVERTSSTPAEDFIAYNINRSFKTNEVLERKQKDVLNLDKQKNINYYDEGDNIVYLSDYAYKAPNSSVENDKTDSIFYYIEYEPLIDARVQVGDNEYVQQINQTASQVDSEKFGKFMQNYLDGMAKADYTIQRTTEYPQKYMAYFGSKVRRDDKTYMITNVALRNRNFQYDMFFQLNENHTRKNMCYQAPQNIRTNTSIQYSNILDRKISIKETFKIGLKPVNNQPKYLKDIRPLVSMLSASVDRNYYPQFANITNASNLVTSSGEPKQVVLQRSTNIAAFVSSNQVCINIDFLNNAIAGKTKGIETKTQQMSDGDVNRIYIDPFNRVENQYPVLYTDPFGEIEKTSIDLVSVVGTNLSTITSSGAVAENKQAYEITKSFQQSMSKLFQDSVVVDKSVISIPNLNIQKDMHEDFNVTYQSCLEGEDGIEILPDFLTHSRLAYGGYYSGKMNMELYEDFNNVGLIETIKDVSRIIGSNYVEYMFRTNKNPKSVRIKYKFPSPGGTEIDLLSINNYNEKNWKTGFKIYY